MEFRVIIPARYASERLPGKALLEIGGKPMIQHVYERACESGAESVVIATDDDKIYQAAKKFDAQVYMTSAEHRSGTERLSEVVVALGYENDDIVVNVQGDEPLIPPSVIQQVAEDLAAHDNVKMATLCEPIKNTDDLLNSDVVKVIMNQRNYALYFSRAPIPWMRDNFPPKEGKTLGDQEHFRHIGIYGYRVGFIQQYIEWEPCPLEKMESLEQLRVLWNGAKIHVGLAKAHVPAGVDTKEDLARVKAHFEKVRA